MFKVDDFLVKENRLIKRIYGEFCAERMEFDKNDYNINEERMVRLVIEDKGQWKNYNISIPWEFAVGNKKPPVSSLVFDEWNGDEDIQMESDMLLHVRLELEKLLKHKFFKIRQSPIDIFERIKKTELYHHRIRPQHVKQGIYLLIQHAKIVIRGDGDRYCFQGTC